MKILSLDISSVCVGYSVFEDTQLIEAGKYHQVGERHGARLAAFSGWLRVKFDEFKPDQVVIEMPFPVARKNTYGVLMMYVGTAFGAHFAAFGHEIPEDNLIPAALVKRTLKIPAQATYEDRKQIIVTSVNKWYGLKLQYKADDRTKQISDDDVADAIALARTWLVRKELHGRERDSKSNRSRKRPSKIKAGR